MELAKPNIDVGIYTNKRDEQLKFWQEQAGLEYEELLKVGGGTHQHRHNLNGSVLKMNHTRSPLASDSPSGLKKLMIAKDDITDVIELVDPDGNQVTLVPKGHQGIEQIGIQLAVSNLAAFQTFYRDVLQIEEITPTSYRWGNTLFFIEQADEPVAIGEMKDGIGYRYLTVQVFGVDKEHKAFVERGGVSGLEPFTLGTTARISFIRDPDGNWIEISQRASLTGSLEVVE